MNINHWLIRKYPNSFDEISDFLNNDPQKIKEFKDGKYRIGLLNKTITTFSDEEYQKGSMVMWRRYKIYIDCIWIGEFDIYCLVKCLREGVTTSGYHSINISEHDIDEITS